MFTCVYSNAGRGIMFPSEDSITLILKEENYVRRPVWIQSLELDSQPPSDWYETTNDL